MLEKLLEWCEAEIKKIEADPRFHYKAALVQVNAPLALEQIQMKTRRNTLIEMRDKLAPPSQTFVISWDGDRNLLDKVLDDVRECLGVDNETVTGSIKPVRFQQGLGEGVSYEASVCVGAHQATWRAGDEFAALYGAALKAVEMALDEARMDRAE